MQAQNVRLFEAGLKVLPPGRTPAPGTAEGTFDFKGPVLGHHRNQRFGLKQVFACFQPQTLRPAGGDDHRVDGELLGPWHFHQDTAAISPTAGIGSAIRKLRK